MYRFNSELLVRLALVFAMGALPALAEEAPAKASHPVLLCGSGPSPYYDALVGRLSDALHAKHVSIRVAADSDLSFTACMAKGVELSATSMLFLVVESP